MDQFHDGQHVCLRSRVHGTYLHADNDREGVSLRRRRTSLNAAWMVHIYHGDSPYLLLHNTAYGRFLTATTTPAPRGHRGFRVEQSNFHDQPEVEAIMWQAVRAGSGNDIDVLLRNVGGRYLRSNGRYLFWNNSVSVDEPENVSAMMHWIVEPIPDSLSFMGGTPAADELQHPDVNAED